MIPLPRRLHSLLTISRRVCAVFTLGVLSLALAGCPGELDPRLLATGTGGTGGTGGPPPCDGAALMKSKCSQAGCHGASSPAAGLDLFSDGVISRLLGQPSRPDLNTQCPDNTKPLLVSGSTSGEGFLIDKLIPPQPCGAIMPQVPGPLSATELQCMQDWATAVTTGRIQ